MALRAAALYITPRYCLRGAAFGEVDSKKKAESWGHFKEHIHEVVAPTSIQLSRIH